MSGVFEPSVRYGPGGFDPTKPNNNVLDSGQTELLQALVNERGIRDKAKLALTANATYLALPNPTAAQNTAQIKRLTRECNGLIRLLLAELQDVSDT